MNKENWAYQRNLEGWNLPGCPPCGVADEYNTNFRQIIQYNICLSFRVEWVGIELMDINYVSNNIEQEILES